ncbi:MAG: hypothetical protein IPH13_18340 [Planctomycetes bacterium]|nr:hypothetical protein [Planctomycetota bacterium]MCC7169115.1 hypothetical protein [Planctomycetota bacterium]
MHTVAPVARSCFVALLLPWSACAQTASPVGDETRNDDALPLVGEPVAGTPSSVWCVFEDRRGHHWFGSRGEGATCWDGESFVRFTTEHGLASDDVRSIQEDDAGQLYFGSGTSITRFDGRALRSLTMPESTSPLSEWKLVPTDLWFAGAQDTGVVFRTDGETVHRLVFPSTAAGDAVLAKYPRSRFPNAKFSPYDVYTIFKDRSGNVWFGTSSLGACRFDGASFTWISEDELEYRTMLTGEQSFGVRGIVEDDDGKFWFSNFRNRFAVVASESIANGGAPIRFVQEPGAGDPNDLLESGAALFHSGVKDAHGHVWTATYGAGVWRYDGKELTRFAITHDAKPIMTLSIAQDRRGVLWVGTEEHGPYRYDGERFVPFAP